MARTRVADALITRLPGLSRVSTTVGVSILPVDADFIDSVVNGSSDQNGGEDFKLLTGGFRSLLRELSQFGCLAYIETDYFGGLGGQGAAVFADGQETMPPKWSRSGTINEALARLGVPRSLLCDRFSAIGLPKYRTNEDLMDAAVRD